MGLTKKDLQCEKAITLTKFLLTYCHVDSQNISKLRHKDIDVFNIPGIKKVPFSTVDIDDVRKSDVILVLDRDNNIAAYLNPRKCMNFSENDISINYKPNEVVSNIVPFKKEKFEPKQIKSNKKESKEYKKYKEKVIKEEILEIINEYKNLSEEKRYGGKI